MEEDFWDDDEEDEFEKTVETIETKGTREHRKFPDDLDSRLNAVLNVVNTELKSATLLHLDNRPADKHEIKARVRGTIGRGNYLPGTYCFLAYCRTTLFPIGMVAREEITRDEGDSISVGYSLTDAGRKYGLPIAAFSLRYAVDNDLSLFTILGSTASSGEVRSPIVRARIIKALADKDLSEIELKRLSLPHRASFRAISCSSIVINHIIPLQEAGLIDFISESDDVAGVAIHFVPTLKQGTPTPFRRNTLLTQKVLNHLNLRDSLTSSETASFLGHSRSSDSLNILNHLFRQGFAERSKPIGKYSFNNSTLVSLNKRGRLFIDEYLVPVENALTNGTSLNELTEDYKFFINNPEHFAEVIRGGINLYREVSPKINQRPCDETLRIILAYLHKNPGARPIDIEKDLDISRVQNHLTPMVKSGSVRKDNLGHGTRYYAI